MLSILSAVLLLLAGPAQAPEAKQPQPARQPPAGPAAGQQPGPWSGPLPGEVVHVTEAPGLKVFFKKFPLSSGLAHVFQGERPGAPRMRMIDYPLARIETSVPLTVGGARLAPASYALVLIPSRGGQPMQMEVRRVAAGEFPLPNPGTTPPAEPVARLPFHGTFGAPQADTLTVEAAPRAGGGATIKFHYGDWQAALELLP